MEGLAGSDSLECLALGGRGDEEDLEVLIPTSFRFPSMSFISVHFIPQSQSLYDSIFVCIWKRHLLYPLGGFWVVASGIKEKEEMAFFFSLLIEGEILLKIGKIFLLHLIKGMNHPGWPRE